MIKLLKKIFSSKNFKKAAIINSLSEPNLPASDYAELINILKAMDAEDNNTTKEIKFKKAA